mmetsp:Transcript_7478/g.31114  ORF Transcript_7478/g.31114 Transcript_7478/m.31114 type:complete len:375 (+) Transcript_7478:280-1404(+)
MHCVFQEDPFRGAGAVRTWRHERHDLFRRGQVDQPPVLVRRDVLPAARKRRHAQVRRVRADGAARRRFYGRVVRGVAGRTRALFGVRVHGGGGYRTRLDTRVRRRLPVHVGARFAVSERRRIGDRRGKRRFSRHFCARKRKRFRWQSVVAPPPASALGVPGCAGRRGRQGGVARRAHQPHAGSVSVHRARHPRGRARPAVGRRVRGGAYSGGLRGANGGRAAPRRDHRKRGGGSVRVTVHRVRCHLGARVYARVHQNRGRVPAAGAESGGGPVPARGAAVGGGRRRQGEGAERRSEGRRSDDERCLERFERRRVGGTQSGGYGGGRGEPDPHRSERDLRERPKGSAWGVPKRRAHRRVRARPRDGGDPHVKLNL